VNASSVAVAIMDRQREAANEFRFRGTEVTIGQGSNKGQDVSKLKKIKTLVECDSNCSLHGECIDGECECEPGFEGDSCGVESVCEPSTDCSGHGVCRYGICFCDPGYNGTACELMNELVCPQQCSGNGFCAASRGGCECMPGYVGASCAERDQSASCPLECSGNGVCVGGRCECNVGYVGADCTQVLPTEGCQGDGKNCSGRGICHSTHCFCMNGYTGAQCETAISNLVTAQEAKMHSSSLKVSRNRPHGSHVGALLGSHLTTVIAVGIAMGTFIIGAILSVAVRSYLKRTRTW